MFETYERLRQAFWTEQRPPVIIIKHALSEPEPKRPTTRKEEEAKPEKTKPIAVQQQKKPVRAPTTTTTTATTLWDIKKSLIRQLRGDLARKNSKAGSDRFVTYTFFFQGYDEKQVLDQLADCDSRCSRIEKRHLAQYLMPVIEATRRRSRNISHVLEKWLQ